LSTKLIADPLVGTRIGRIAWIEAKDDGRNGLRLTASHVAASKFRRPRNSRSRTAAPERELVFLDPGDNADWRKQSPDF